MLKKMLFLSLFITTISFSGEWEIQNFPSEIEYCIFQKIQFQDINTGYASGSAMISGEGTGLILKTIDSGENWSILYQNTDSTYTNFINLFMFDNIGWVSTSNKNKPDDYGGYKSVLLKTTDSGENWSEISVDSGSVKIKSQHFLNGNIGWIYYDKEEYVDWEYTFTHLLKKTIDGGNSWITLMDTSFANNDSIDALIGFTPYFYNENLGWKQYMKNIFMYTTDGGATWTEVALPFEDENDNVSDIFFISEEKGWICGNGKIYHTTDGGLTWTKQYSLNIEYGNAFSGVHFYDENHGFVCGANGRIRETNDGGINWLDNLNGYDHFVDIFFVDATHGWTISFNNIYKYNNTTEIHEDVHLVNDFKLDAINYPNPFNPTTTFVMNIPESQNLSFKIFNIQGKLVEKKDFGYTQKGTYYHQWNATDHPSGTYIYQIKTEQNIFTNKCLLIK